MTPTAHPAPAPDQQLRYWRAAGTVTIILCGFLLHYLFAWSGNSGIIGLVTPVNESAWEHLKLGYWAVVLFSLAEYPFVRRHVHNYFIAKTAGVLVLELTILAIFYGYMALAHKGIFWLDIFSYVLGAFIGQHLVYMIVRKQPYPPLLNRFCLAVFVALGVLFGVATYHPPHTGLFRDNNTHSYGIHRE